MKEKQQTVSGLVERACGLVSDDDVQKQPSGLGPTGDACAETGCPDPSLSMARAYLDALGMLSTQICWDDAESDPPLFFFFYM